MSSSPVSQPSEDPDLRTVISKLLSNKQKADLRESITGIKKKREEDDDPETQQHNSKTRKKTIRKVTLIKIRPKKPQQTVQPQADDQTSKSDQPGASPTVVIPVDPQLKTPMKRKRCNRCKRYGHINQQCPSNPKNIHLIPPPPPQLLSCPEFSDDKPV